MSRPLLVALCCLAFPAVAGARPPEGPDGVSRLLSRLESVLLSGAPSRYAPLLSALADRRRADAFATEMIGPGIQRAVVRERDRVQMDGALPGAGYVVTADVLLEGDRVARLSTWRFDARRVAAAGEAGEGEAVDEEWRISDQAPLAELPVLHRLVLDRSQQWVADNITITAHDLRLTVPHATVFTAQAGGRPTALVVLGRGEMRFAPAPRAERGQLRIYSGAESLQTPFEALVVHLPSHELAQHVSGSWRTVPADPARLKEAEEVFAQDGHRSYVLDLGELSPEPWSLLPSDGDFIAEIRTRRFGTLTYARSAADAEDVALFHRASRRNIAVYASPEQVARRGRFYGEDDRADFRVTSYDIDASFDPAARRIEGQARLKVTVRAPLLKALTLRLADGLAVTDATSDEWGRLLAVRVRNQNSVVLNLPSAVGQDATFTVRLSYSGRLLPQAIDQEALGQIQERDEVTEEVPLAESYLYSNRSYWYPQAPTFDYATATLRLHVPSNYGCVASGRLVEARAPSSATRRGLMHRFTFVAAQPVRYLACLITPLVHAGSAVLRVGNRAADAAGQSQELNLAVQTNPRLRRTASSLAASARDVLEFYTGLMGESPYGHETVAAVERRVPGGHSPAYMAVLSQPVPGSRLQWRDDPAAFEGFPEFFVAHELAHQWWGQAVGWKNYHEQWLSEGLAQYFAALYAERVHGRPVFDSILRRFRDSALRSSGQGPIYLGYRIGHLNANSRAFRAIVYNKSALVLHTLRRSVGDEAFFRGLRRFYATWRFKKAGSDDLRREMEAAAGRSLERFFRRWVYEEDVPTVSYAWRTEQGADGKEAVIRLAQAGDPFDLAVTVTLECEDGTRAELVMPMTEAVSEQRMPVPSAVRKVEVNRDGAALGIFRSEK